MAGDSETGYAGTLEDPSARRLTAGELEAVFLPAHGMLGASLRHRGAELLRRNKDLATMAAKGSSAGIPLLYPWANRLAGFGYRAAGREVALDEGSALLHLDEFGLPIHGVPWARLAWQVTDSRPNSLSARLNWAGEALLAIFPFRHRVEMTVALRPEGLAVDTIVAAGPDGPVPVSFGFHPYFGLPDAARDEWRLALPAMRRLALDPHQIPTGASTAFDGMDGPLAGHAFDDGFALTGAPAEFALQGAGRRIEVRFGEGYRYAQVFAPAAKDFVALEPMTAPTNALASGEGLPLVPPGGTYRASFEIRVATVAA